jgi:hypothetical protein
MTETPEKQTWMQCWTCAHLSDGPSMTCKAYPEGIPDALQLGRESHSRPYKGDNGIRWKPRPEDTDE